LKEEGGAPSFDITTTTSSSSSSSVDDMSSKAENTSTSSSSSSSAGTIIKLKKLSKFRAAHKNDSGEEQKAEWVQVGENKIGYVECRLAPSEGKKTKAVIEVRYVLLLFFFFSNFL
jgi:hypothetical protein